MATLFIILGVLVLLGLVLLVAFVLVLPNMRAAAAERARIEREVQTASWQIHQQATHAFGQMLDAARETKPDDWSRP